MAEQTILMFSGGRDSTLAALRMAVTGEQNLLVTVSSAHLIGIERVRARLRELLPHLGPSTRWCRVIQPTDLRTDVSFYDRTCLPCHHAYVVVSGVLARALGASRLAFGYTGYQREWPEQTPLAVARLRSVLDRHGIALELPVYNVLTKDAANAELCAHGLSIEALEQKCLRQISNVRLTDERLQQQIALWESAIDDSMSRVNELRLEIAEERQLGDFG
jgi:hypothetical protein